MQPFSPLSPSPSSVVERPGRIRIVDRDGTLLPEPFLDNTDHVYSLTLEQG